MKQAAAALAFIARFAVLGLAGAFVVSVLWPDVGHRLRAHFGLNPPNISAPAVTVPVEHGAGLVSYADAVKRAAPSVVNIYANKIVSEPVMQIYNSPIMRRLLVLGGHSPSQQFLYPNREQSLGSGVIFNHEGYVLTNNHVIEKANDIQVLLYDGRVAQATVVGTDAETDLAVLKINASNLPVTHLADYPPHTGDVVLAIGNPLGLNQTVTMGIVSAIGRQLNSDSPEDFIQTDAAINPGNSGGALINSQGDLVGINTLLIGKDANDENIKGISFAIPVGSAKNVLEQIIATGHVVRGWLGANYTFVPIAAASGIPAAASGAMVTTTAPDGPAAQAGIQPGDILLRIGTDTIVDPPDLRRREAMLKPGSAVEVWGLRNSTPFHTQVTVAERPPPVPTVSLNG